MRAPRNAQLALMVLMGVATGAALAASGFERSLAVYPKQYIPVKFDHALHLKNDLDCVSCHDAARQSTQVRDVNMPRHPECDSCHDIEAASRGEKTDPPAGCEVCHVRFDPSVQRSPPVVVMPTANLHFDHRLHVDKKIECKECHSDMTDVGLASRAQLPKMSTCLRCHDGAQASGSCKGCHPAEPSGRLTLAFASGVLRPAQGNPFGMDHGPRFELTHGTRASTDRETCLQCHAMSECQSCHDALQKPLSIHPNDYLTLHGIQARTESLQCSACHRTQSFCIACHERAGVGLDGDPSFASRNVRVHPDPAIWTDIPNPQHHGIAASRDMKVCTSCHREESCLQCHAATSVRRVVNPHPDGFRASCRKMAAKNDRACLRCHTEQQLVGLGCR